MILMRTNWFPKNRVCVGCAADRTLTGNGSSRSSPTMFAIGLIGGIGILLYLALSD